LINQLVPHLADCFFHGYRLVKILKIYKKVDELLEIDPADKRHFFYEEMKRLFYAMREIQPEDIDDESLDQFMSAADQLSNAIYTIELKRRKQKKITKLMAQFGNQGAK